MVCHVHFKLRFSLESLKMKLAISFNFIFYYCEIPVSHTINCHVFGEKKSRILIRDAQGDKAQLYLMLVTTHHTKHILNNEYLTSAAIMHIF